MSATVTGTVTINAAFLQEIKEDNRELHHLLQRLAAIASQSAFGVKPRHLVELLTSLRDQLAMHFALEEAYGYFDDAVSVTPTFSRDAEQMRGEHVEMFDDICAIVEKAEQLLYHEAPSKILRQIVTKFTEWHHRFEQHEEREVSLAYTVLRAESAAR